MKVLITGGAGFIGYHVASRMRALGHEIALVDNFNTFYDPDLKRQNVRDLQSAGPVTLHEADILDRRILDGIFAEEQPDAVIHLAAWAGVRPSLENPEIYAQVNVTGTVNLLECARKQKVKSFVFGSSSSVYGGNSKTPFSETDPVDRPVSPYAATKRAGELLCHSYCHNYGMHITCLRFFTVYGPRQRPEMAIHKFARLIWEEKVVPIFGNGESRRDYTYVDDITQGIAAAIVVNKPYDIFNLGEAQTISLLDLVSELEQALGKKAVKKFLPPQPGDMEITFADISHARESLGYQPVTPIREGIKKFVSWFLENNK